MPNGSSTIRTSIHLPRHGGACLMSSPFNKPNPKGMRHPKSFQPLIYWPPAENGIEFSAMECPNCGLTHENVFGKCPFCSEKPGLRKRQTERPADIDGSVWECECGQQFEMTDDGER